MPGKPGKNSKPDRRNRATGVLVWFRRDLRLSDNPALAAAVARGGAVIPVFIWAPGEEGEWPPGAASRWWLHHSLTALAEDLRALGSRLIVREGPTAKALASLGRETGAGTILWNRLYEPAIRERDGRVERMARATGVSTESFNAALLHEPGTIANRSGRPFQVFTPFWKHCLDLPEPACPVPAPRVLRAPVAWPKSLAIGDLGLLPESDWAGGLRASWSPGETGAKAQLERFVHQALAAYELDRDRPDRAGTSRLSPSLHFGEVSPRQVWHQVRRALQSAKPASGSAVSRRNRATRTGPDAGWRESKFLAELGWREFAHQLLYHFPHTDQHPLRPEFAKFRWRKDTEWLRAWQRGRTGFPIVDAGLRELWATGWMHNRVRMVVGSFLVKDLLITWQEGARWFWDTLVDADLAQNTLGWQWISGCGADAAPYFRVFNPVAQGVKFDPDGSYVRRWVPELARLPSGWIHEPRRAPPDVLARAGVRLGDNYPLPIVSHSVAREVALEAYAALK